MDADQILEQLFAASNFAENPGSNLNFDDHLLPPDDQSAEEIGGLELDYDLPADEVIQRIENCALWLIEQLLNGALPDLSLDTAAAQPPPLTTTTATGPSSSAPQVLSLSGRHTESAERYARVWQVLNISHELLSSDCSAAQRELHYRLKTTETFKTHSHLASAIQDAVKLLRVPRSLLGICCSGKGLVGGRLIIHSTHSSGGGHLEEETIDCQSAGGGRGHLIPGDLNIIQSYSYATDAQCILVVEKETVFQRLIAAKMFDMAVPAILVCGKGVPDVATRAFLSALHATFPLLPVVGLVDWNPSGVGILSIYRWGSPRMIESRKYVVPQLQWMGARAHNLKRLPDGTAFQELTTRDYSLIPGLMTRLAAAAPAWAGELDQMKQSGSKAELEAVYEACGGADEFARFIADALEQKEWV